MRVTFSGNWNDQDVIWLHIGASAIGKTVFGGQDSSNTIARHFANFINAIFDGVWASVSGSVLTVTSHSFASGWQYHVYTELPASNTGSGHAAVTGRHARRHVWREVVMIRSNPDAGAQPGLPRLEFGFLWPAQGERHERRLLVLAGTGAAAGQSSRRRSVVQRFPDGTAVETATGFGTLNSSQIAFSSGHRTT